MRHTLLFILCVVANAMGMRMLAHNPTMASDTVVMQFARSQWTAPLAMYATRPVDSIAYITSVSITGSASPEGPAGFNDYLSRQRAMTLGRYIGQTAHFPMDSMHIRWIGADTTGYARIHKLNPFASKQTLYPPLRNATAVITYNKPYVRFDNAPMDTVESDSLTYSAMMAVLQSDMVDVSIHPVARQFNVALRTNVLLDVAALPNVGLELIVCPRWSIAADWFYGWWCNDSRHRYWRAYGGNITGRYWLSSQTGDVPVYGHHIDVSAGAFIYDFEFGGRGHMGGIPGGSIWDRCNYMASVGYGYALPVSQNLRIDFGIGLGWIGGKQVVYEPCHHCHNSVKGSGYRAIRTCRANWVGPVRAEIALVWLLPSTKKN